MRPWATLLAVSFSPAIAQNLSPETLLLSRIKLKAAENVHSLPNFTCLETIERSRRPAGSHRFQLVDVLRLEVAYIDRKEVFAWPGSTSFENTELRNFAPRGTSGNGSFALHVQSVFLSNVPTYQHRGETERDGRPSIKYDYHIPRLHSGYRMRIPPNEGIVGYHGSFFVDPKSLDLQRLEIHINEIPPELAVLEAREDLDYQTLRIGDRDFVLPAKAILTITDFHGGISRNETTFSGCREFKGNSVIRFDDAPTSEAVPKPRQRVFLPPGLDFDFRIDDPLVAGKFAIGDPIHGTVTHDAKRKGTLWIPKGATVSARITLMELFKHRQGDYWLIGITCDRIEWEDRYAEVFATMAPYGALVVDRQITALQSRAVDLSLLDHRRTGILYMKGDLGKMPAGTRTSWTVQVPPTPPPTDNNPEKTGKNEVRK